MVSSICQEGGRSSGVVSGVGFAGVLGEGEVEAGLEEVEVEGSGKGEVITNCSTFSN